MDTTAYASVIPAQGEQTTSPYFRKTALIAGVIYLLTFVSIPTLWLYAPIHISNYIISDGPDTKVIIGAILELIVGLAGIATAVVLYPVLKKQNVSGALGLVASRVLEAAMIFGGVAFLLTIVSLRQGGVGSDAVITGQALVTMYDRIFLIGQSLMPAVNDLLLGFLFYHSRLIPRALALIGIIGSFILVSGDIAIMFGVLEQRAPSTALAAVPVAVFEFTLGIWLVVKGFRNPSKI
jgi:hypothetical protein